MKKNIGCLDRILRFLAIDLLMGVLLYGVEISPKLNTVFLVLSAYLVLTILFGFSPFYHLVKFSTLELKNEN